MRLGGAGVCEDGSYFFLGGCRVVDLCGECGGGGFVGVAPCGGLADVAYPFFVADVCWFAGCPCLVLCLLSARVDGARHLGALAL